MAEVQAARRQLDLMLVADLKELLGRLGQARGGNKSDLKSRVLALLNAGDPALSARTAAIVGDYYKKKLYGASPTAGGWNEPFYMKQTSVSPKPLQRMGGSTAEARGWSCRSASFLGAIWPQEASHTLLAYRQ